MINGYKFLVFLDLAGITLAILLIIGMTIHQNLILVGTIFSAIH